MEINVNGLFCRESVKVTFDKKDEDPEGDGEIKEDGEEEEEGEEQGKKQVR